MKHPANDAVEADRKADSSKTPDISAIGASILQRGRGALILLWEAYECASDVDRPVWDFAMEIDSLRAVGLTNSGLRWLVCRGFLEHAREVATSVESRRVFRRSGDLTFRRESCFVLTEAGARFVHALIGRASPVEGAFAPGEMGPNSPPGRTSMPKWDRDRQELRLGGRIVKQFKLPAVNQERILAAFEEEGWPVHIDDPLPPHPEQDPKRRLHDTINSLNRNQKVALIRFQGDGTGQGVRWHLLRPNENGESVNNSHS